MNNDSTSATSELAETPEDVLRGFWNDFAECEQSPQWDEPGLDWNDYREAMLTVLQRYCTERIYEGWKPGGRERPSRYSDRYKEDIVDTKVTKSKAYIYTRRANSSISKHCWVLKTIDGVWKIDRRKQEGMKLDQYREIPVC